MDKGSFTSLLLGKDLRTINQNSIVVQTVNDQHTFDGLFSLVFHHERSLVMRAVDAFPNPVVGLKGVIGLRPKGSVHWETSGTYVPKFESFYTEGGNVYLKYTNFQGDVSYSRTISNFHFSMGTKLRYMHLFQESMEDTNLITTLTMGPYVGVVYNF